MSNLSVVTGVAGFIGSNLAERLLAEGHRVIGIDCFTDYYAREAKEANLAGLGENPGFSLTEADLCDVEIAPLLRGARYIYHEAAQPGVRASWGTQFRDYSDNNLLATQRLLEAARDVGVIKFVFASSSSVYGNPPHLPTREDSPLRPYSPYGVTKLAAENLCHLYHDNFGLPTVALRYFTVFGPRQRPDMAFRRFMKSMIEGEPLTLYGDGDQTRDFTYVADIVEANLLAARSDVSGRALNIGGGTRITVRDVIAKVGQALGIEPRIERLDVQHGDARHTWADTTAARELLGFKPRFGLDEGLAREAAWVRERRESLGLA
jgi:nucleoside-diphosphate-sugar epimerase